jgi:hypothetical protein
MNLPGDTGGVSPLVEFIIRNPGLSAALIRQHVDDGGGYCRRCALGAQRGYHRFPCDIRRTAERAREIERANR